MTYISYRYSATVLQSPPLCSVGSIQAAGDRCFYFFLAKHCQHCCSLRAGDMRHQPVRCGSCCGALAFSVNTRSFVKKRNLLKLNILSLERFPNFVILHAVPTRTRTKELPFTLQRPTKQFLFKFLFSALQPEFVG